MNLLAGLKKPVVWIILLFLLILVLIFLIFKPAFLQKKENTGKPEVKKEVSKTNPGNCLILEQEFCDQGTAYEDPSFPGLTFIGFNLPEGTPIFAYRDGTTIYNDETGFDPSAHKLLLINPSLDQASHNIFGDIKPVKPGNIKKGDSIGYAQNTGIRIKGKFNVAVNFATTSNNSFVNDTETMQTLFPNAK